MPREAAIRFASASATNPPLASNSSWSRANRAMPPSRAAPWRSIGAGVGLLDPPLQGADLTRRRIRSRAVAWVLQIREGGLLREVAESAGADDRPLRRGEVPASVRIRVVLPAPFRPTRPILSPDCTLKEAPSSKVRGPTSMRRSRAINICGNL